jgi:hypothetical protein
MPRIKKLLTATLAPEKLILIIRDAGGYLTGECLLCGAVGWANTSHTVANLGVPYQASSRNKTLLGNEIKHTADCVLGKSLDDRGKFISSDPKLIIAAP